MQSISLPNKNLPMFSTASACPGCGRATSSSPLAVADSSAENLIKVDGERHAVVALVLGVAKAVVPVPKGHAHG
jgi:hypothetical protein